VAKVLRLRKDTLFCRVRLPMSHSKPLSPELREPELAFIQVGAKFWRIYLDRYPDPLGYGKTPSRFSDPRRRVERNRFGVVYLGSSLDVCVAEAIVRDNRDGSATNYLIPQTQLDRYRLAEIAVVAPLLLVDLRGNAPIRMGVPSDVVRGKKQTQARGWSVAFHEHSDAPDGIVYSSRLNGETNLAIYSRALPKLKIVQVISPLNAAGFARVLDTFRVAIV
jgi:hypothetical protein